MSFALFNTQLTLFNKIENPYTKISIFNMADVFFERNKDSECSTFSEGTEVCQSLPPRNDNWNVGYDDTGTSAVIGAPATLISDDDLIEAGEGYLITGLAEDITTEILDEVAHEYDQGGDDWMGASGEPVDITAPTASGAYMPSSEEDPPSDSPSISTMGGVVTTDVSVTETPTITASSGGGTTVEPFPERRFIPSESQLVDMITALLGGTGLTIPMGELDFAIMIIAKLYELRPLFSLIGHAIDGLKNKRPEEIIMAYPGILSLIRQLLRKLFDENDILEIEKIEKPKDEDGLTYGDSDALFSAEETEKMHKAEEYENELDFMYDEYVKEMELATPCRKNPEIPFLLDVSLPDVKPSERLNKMFSTYYGINEQSRWYYWTFWDPRISTPGTYSFWDKIDQDLKNIKHESLRSIATAKLLLTLVPWLFTTNPNRAREANRRARHIKKKIFEAVMYIPSMLDLWDGIGEWTTPYITMDTLDKSQLKIEMWGSYFGGTYFHPRVVRDSVIDKNFRDDKLRTQAAYNKVNDFMQYCMGNAYLFDERVENGTWSEMTTSYRTRSMMKVGERLKGDMFFNRVILPAASPWPIAYWIIGLSRYLIEYIIPKVEITQIITYDRNTLADDKRHAYLDVRGFKRMHKFTKLDRSGLDVINDE